MIKTIKHLEHVTGSSEEDIRKIISDIDNFYYHIKEPKTKFGKVQTEKNGDIRYRELYPSRYPLKNIQKKISHFLQQIQLPDYAFGSVKKRNNILNTKQHRLNKYFLTVDLKNFFPNINHHQVFKMFRQNDFSPTVTHLLTKLTTYKGGLPQGAPTSPIIANLAFIETGNKLLDLIKDHNISFTSFLDDLTFSSKMDFKYLTPTILETVKSGGFYIHHKKINYKSFKPEITGLFIYKKMLLVKDRMKKDAKTNQHLAAYLAAIKAANRS
jgi:RNA-directed DNA polymerase